MIGRCGSAHPEIKDVVCGVREPLALHEDHIGFLKGKGVVDWANTDFRPTVKLDSDIRQAAWKDALEVFRVADLEDRKK